MGSVERINRIVFSSDTQIYSCLRKYWEFIAEISSWLMYRTS